MSSKHSKRKKKSRNECANNYEIKNISEEDLEELRLLYIQELAVGIFLYSDLFFYLNTNQNIKLLLDSNDSDDKQIEIEKVIKTIYSFYYFGVYGLKAVILFLIVDATRYKNLNIENSKGDKFKSVIPELFISFGGFFQVICYKYFVISAIEFYKRALFNFYYIYNADKELLLNITIYMRLASLLRISADCYFNNSTILSINKIYNKYSKEKTYSNLGSPTSILLQGTIIYTVARFMFLKANILIYNEVFVDTDSDNKQIYLLPNKIVIIGHVFGVISNLIALYGIANAYMREMNQPVVGI